MHHQDDGELWSLNYDGKRFVCWKCGSPMHIGDRCNNQGRTFHELFNGSETDDTFEKPTWAAIVRSGVPKSEEERRKEEEMELKIKENNKVRDREEREKLEQERLQKEEEEFRKIQREQERLDAVKKAEEMASAAVNNDYQAGSIDEDSSETDRALAQISDDALQSMYSSRGPFWDPKGDLRGPFFRKKGTIRGPIQF